MSDIFGTKISVSKLLPETIKDENGRDVKLLGVLVPDGFFGFEMSLDFGSCAPERRIVFFVEDDKPQGNGQKVDGDCSNSSSSFPMPSSC